MTDIRTAMLLPLLLLFSCDDLNQPTRNENSSENVRVRITARYDPNLLGQNVVLYFTNEENFEVCFSAAELGPGYGRTFVRDGQGTILNDSSNSTLEMLKGVNVAGPIVVLRAGRPHSEFIDLSEFHESNRTLILQAGVALFRCGHLFDPRVREVRTYPIERIFRLSDGRIVEQVNRRFSEEAAPRPAPAVPEGAN